MPIYMYYGSSAGTSGYQVPRGTPTTRVDLRSTLLKVLSRPTYYVLVVVLVGTFYVYYQLVVR